MNVPKMFDVEYKSFSASKTIANAWTMQITVKPYSNRNAEEPGEDKASAILGLMANLLETHQTQLGNETEFDFDRFRSELYIDFPIREVKCVINKTIKLQAERVTIEGLVLKISPDKGYSLNLKCTTAATMFSTLVGQNYGGAIEVI